MVLKGGTLISSRKSLAITFPDPMTSSYVVARVRVLVAHRLMFGPGNSTLNDDPSPGSLATIKTAWEQTNLISIIYDLRKKCNNEVVTQPLPKYLVLHVHLLLVFILNKLLMDSNRSGVF